MKKMLKFLIVMATVVNSAVFAAQDLADFVAEAYKLSSSEEAMFNLTDQTHTSAFWQKWSLCPATLDYISQTPENNALNGDVTRFEGTDDSRMKTYVAYGTNGLYILNVAYDDNYVNLLPGVNADYECDAVSMFLDVNSTEYSMTNNMYIIGGRTAGYCQVQLRFGGSEAPTTMQYLTMEAGTTTDKLVTVSLAQASADYKIKVKSVDLGSGYKAQEWCFSWDVVGSGINIPAVSSGTKIAFQVGYNDADGPTLSSDYSCLRWTQKDPYSGAMTSNNRTWGDIIFVGTLDDACPIPLTLPPLPPAPTLVAPVTRSSGISATPTLVWSTVANVNAYAVQVSTDSINFGYPAVNQPGLATPSYTVSASLIKGTKYFWRVNAANSAGASAWSAVWSFTTIVGLPAPILTSPGTGAINIEKTPALTWGASTGATSYTVQVSTVFANFTSFVVNQSGLTALTYTVSPALAGNTTYYWRVNASNGGGAGAWSAVFNFSVAPDAPVLFAPVNNSANIVINPTVSWNASAGAATYRVQVATNSGYSPTIFDDSTISTTSKALSGLLTNTSYYWRVNAKNSKGTSAWSASRIFSTIASVPQSAPLTISPVSGALNTPVSIPLSWHSVPTSSTYHLQLSTMPDFSVLLKDTSGIIDTGFVLPNLSYSTKYYWCVCGTNAVGAGGWSLTANFTTMAPIPITPTIVSPTTGAINIPVTTSLKWHPVPIATSYRVQVSTTPDFGTVTKDSIGIVDTTVSLAGLANNVKYYWCVCASNGNGSSGWSVTANFTTIPSLPTPVTLILPAHGSQISRDSVRLFWQKLSSGVTRYGVMVATDSAMSHVLILDTTLTDTTKLLTQLSPNVSYWWKVKACNLIGWGQYGLKFSFTFPPVKVLQKRIDPTTFSCENSSGVLKYSLPTQNYVSVRYFDTRGKQIASFVDQTQGAGYYTISLPISNWSQGSYIQVFKAGGFTKTEMVSVVR